MKISRNFIKFAAFESGILGKHRNFTTNLFQVEVAIGFGLANVIVIKGDLGCVVIDTLESTQGAQVCIEALKKAQVIGNSI